jgi:hypothetical protein
MTPTITVEVSRNKKLGPCSATYASQVGCPATCKLRNNGCYAESARTGIHTSRLNKSSATASETAQAEADGIDSLSGLMDLRLHVVGDCSTDSTAKKVAAAAGRFISRARPTSAWTYTHAWRTVSRESWGDVSVLASCHNEDEVHEAIALGYACAMTVTEMPDKAYKKGGLLFVPCLEQTCGTNCVSCRLCLDDDNLLAKNIVILFLIHTATIKATEALSSYQ